MGFQMCLDLLYEGVNTLAAQCLDDQAQGVRAARDMGLSLAPSLEGADHVAGADVLLDFLVHVGLGAGLGAPKQLACMLLTQDAFFATKCVQTNEPVAEGKTDYEANLNPPWPQEVHGGIQMVLQAQSSLHLMPA
jgi:hypothetical protein